MIIGTCTCEVCSSLAKVFLGGVEEELEKLWFKFPRFLLLLLDNRVRERLVCPKRPVSELEDTHCRETLSFQVALATLKKCQCTSGNLPSRVRVPAYRGQWPRHVKTVHYASRERNSRLARDSCPWKQALMMKL